MKVRSLHSPEVREGIIRRLDALTPESRGRWGRLTVGQMVCHLADVYEDLFDARGFVFPGKPLLRSFPLKHLALYVLPFPRGVKVTRAVFKTAPSDFAGDVEHAKRCTADFAERAGRNGWPGHPYFGPLSSREWGVFAYKHADHHLRQFRV